MIILDEHNEIKDLIVGEEYLGRIRDKEVILTNKIKGKIINKDSRTYNGKGIVKLERINNNELDFLFVKEFEPLLGEINRSFSGKQFYFRVRVEKINETSGPTLFLLYDGSGFIEAKSFSPGRRALPNIRENDLLNAKLFLRVSQDKKEAELISYTKITGRAAEGLLTKIKEREDKKAEPETRKFLVKSECYERLRGEFIKSAKIIRKAIFESRPIILRHHSDCDGYCGAFALERAILPLIIKEHRNEAASSWYYRRAPSRKPFYSYSDSIKDLSINLSRAKKKPLIIIVDNGSTTEDLLGIKKLKIYDSEVIVIDHHIPVREDGNAIITRIADAHINPHLVGYSSSITAGMLCSELSRFINKDVNGVSFLAALSGFGDKSDSEEFEEYIKMTEKKGFSRDYLKELSDCVDFEGYYLGFIEARNVINDLLGDNIKKQKEIMHLLKDEINRRNEEQTGIIKETMKEEKINSIRVIKLDMDNISLRSEFPPPGKIAGLAFKELEEEGYHNFIILGIANDYIIIRTDIKGFDVNEAIRLLKDKIKYGFISGGGHERAGTVKFIKIIKEKVLKGLNEYIYKLSEKQHTE